MSKIEKIDDLSLKILKHLKKHPKEETYQIIVDLGYTAKTSHKIRYRLNKLSKMGYVKRIGRFGKGYSGYGRSKRFFVWNLTEKGIKLKKGE